MSKQCWFRHRWNRWEQYVERGRATGGILAPKAIQGVWYDYAETRQRRTCERCGKCDDELVSNGVAP